MRKKILVELEVRAYVIREVTEETYNEIKDLPNDALEDDVTDLTVNGEPLNIDYDEVRVVSVQDMETHKDIFGPWA
jgi:hypothetical protein